MDNDIKSISTAAIRETDPTFRGCSADGNSADCVVTVTQDFSFKQFLDEHARTGPGTLPLPMPKSQESQQKLDFVSYDTIVIVENVVFKPDPENQSTLKITLEGSKFDDTVDIVFKNCRFGDPLRSEFSPTVAIVVGRRVNASFENCTFDSYINLLMDDYASAGVVRCYCPDGLNISSSGQYSCTSFSMFDSKFGVLYVSYSRTVCIDDNNIDYEHKVVNIVGTEYVNLFNFKTDPVVNIWKCHDYVDIGNCRIFSMYVRDSVVSMEMLGSHVHFIRLLDSAIKRLSMPDSEVENLSADGTTCKSIGKQPKRIGFAAVTRSYGLPQTTARLYKKALVHKDFLDWSPQSIIVVLDVPESAKKNYDRASHKVRVSEATVVKFLDLEKNDYTPPTGYTVRSSHDPNFVYKTGAVVKPTLQFADNDQACAPGIHGFLDIEDAISY